MILYDNPRHSTANGRLFSQMMVTIILVITAAVVVGSSSQHDGGGRTPSQGAIFRSV
jgi:hypothetical protein